MQQVIGIVPTECHWTIVLVHFYSYKTIIETMIAILFDYAQKPFVKTFILKLAEKISISQYIEFIRLNQDDFIIDISSQ